MGRKSRLFAYSISFPNSDFADLEVEIAESLRLCLRKFPFCGDYRQRLVRSRLPPDRPKDLRRDRRRFAPLLAATDAKGIAPKRAFTHQRNVRGLNHCSSFREGENSIFRLPTFFPLIASGSEFLLPGVASPDAETSSTLAWVFLLGDGSSASADLAGSAA